MQVALHHYSRLLGLSAIPGITPQTIQSASELARRQGIKNSFSNGADPAAQQRDIQASPRQDQGASVQQQPPAQSQAQDNIEKISCAGRK